MTTLCSPWNQGQRDEYPSKALANFLYTSNFSSKEMDDILVEECNNRNTVYVLNSSYRYGNMDMIELFGTPAGRALTVNNKTAAELHQNRRTVAGGSSSSSSSSTTDSHLCPSTIGGLLTGSLHPANISSIKISGPDTVTTAGQHHFIESSEFIRFASSSKAAPSVTSIAFRNKCSSKSADISSSKTGPAHLDQPANRRNNLKMAKFWKLFDEDRLRKANSTERIGDKLRQRWVATPPLERVETVDKSANDLYSEAAQLLGIKCSLTDSCRCIDCQSQYFDCDDDADAYSEYSDKSYDMEDNLFTNRSYYNDLSTEPGVPDADTFVTTTISDRLNQASHNGNGWDTEGNGVPDDVNGNECEHYLHSTHNSSSLNLALDAGQLPANDRSQLPIDTSETERPNGGHQPVPAVPSDEECAGGIKVA